MSVRRLLTHPAVVWALVATTVFGVSAAWAGAPATPDAAYFNELAAAFLDGRLYLDTPISTHDLTLADGRWYVPFLPLVSLLVLPLVAVTGAADAPMTAVACVLGGVTMGVMHQVLRVARSRGIVTLGGRGLHWLTLAWALGSVQWYMATQGTVWFTAQLSATAFASGAVLAALTRRPAIAAVLLAVCMMSRPTLVLLMPALVALAWPSGADRRAVVRHLAMMGAPLVVVALLIAGYNQARFDDPTDLGYTTQNVDPTLGAALAEYGQFDTTYIAHNVWSAVAAGPRWVAETRTLEPDPDGMSIVLTTPVVLLALRARRSRLTTALWVTLGLASIPLVTYYNTGWWQFGYRFALDLMPLLWLLVARGAGERLHAGWKAAIVASIGVNAWGLAWFVG